MVAVIDQALSQMVLPNISWKTFEKILDEIGETHYRVTYDNGELEFMTLSLEHENYGRWIGRLIFLVALELGMPLRTGGSTTLKEALRNIGLEPDECFWIQHAKALRGKKKWSAGKDPPPDLAVEIDITSSWLDRLGIYASLKVPEVWRFDGEMLKILILMPNGEYAEKRRSLTFPSLPIDEFANFVIRLDAEDEMPLVQEFIAWLRSDVVAKPRAKNGKK